LRGLVGLLLGLLYLALPLLESIVRSFRQGPSSFIDTRSSGLYQPLTSNPDPWKVAKFWTTAGPLDWFGAESQGCTGVRPRND
jgi:hypothetical protein